MIPNDNILYSNNVLSVALFVRSTEWDLECHYGRAVRQGGGLLIPQRIMNNNENVK